MLGRIEDKENALRGDRGRDGLNGHDFEQIPGDSEGHESRCAAVHGIAGRQARLSG